MLDFAVMSLARKQLADAHRIVVKLGTHVVTHDGIELALGRVMGLVESMARLRQAGREVLLVSSTRMPMPTAIARFACAQR